MGRLTRAAREEWARWRALLRLLRFGELPSDEETTVDREHVCDGNCKDNVITRMAADTAARERQAQADLRGISSKYHEANQPYTVARAKASMLRRLGE